MLPTSKFFLIDERYGAYLKNTDYVSMIKYICAEAWQTFFDMVRRTCRGDLSNTMIDIS